MLISSPGWKPLADSWLLVRLVGRSKTAEWTNIPSSLLSLIWSSKELEKSAATAEKWPHWSHYFWWSKSRAFAHCCKRLMRSSRAKLSDFENVHLVEVKAAFNRLSWTNSPEARSNLIKRHKSWKAVWNWFSKLERSNSHLSSVLVFFDFSLRRSRRLERSDASLATRVLSVAACRVSWAHFTNAVHVRSDTSRMLMTEAVALSGSILARDKMSLEISGALSFKVSTKHVAKWGVGVRLA